MSEQRADHRQPPRFSGVIVHRDRLGRFSIRYPSDWDFLLQEGKAPDEQDGVTFRPVPEDPHTFFNVWIRELEQGVIAEDLDDLREGIHEGLRQLPGIAVESFVEVPIENLLKFELVYTFQDGTAILRRKAWILFADRWQYMLTWQGSSPEEYDYWLAMANYSFATFELPQALMFATDREMAARFAKELGHEEPAVATEEKPEPAQES